MGRCHHQLKELIHVGRFWTEAREVMWLASVVGGLSALGVGLAVVLAAP
jgi:hypothetical protein